MSHNSKHTVDINNIDINKILMSGETLYDHKKIINNLLDAKVIIALDCYVECSSKWVDMPNVLMKLKIYLSWQ